MSFETRQRTLAVVPELVETLFDALVSTYGEQLPDGRDQELTIGAFWDDTARTRIRAASLRDGSIAPIPLTDGRVAFTALWQADLAAEFDAHGLLGVDELTPAEFSNLQVKATE